MSFANEVIAIETPGTDHLYGQAPDAALRDEFLSHLFQGNPPRKGENRAVNATDWTLKLVGFAESKNANLGTGTLLERSIRARDFIFGAPRAIEPGGALANSFDVLMRAKINGRSIDGRFVTAPGEGPSGKIFADSLSGKIISPAVPEGWHLETHVFPVDGDRVMIAVTDHVDPSASYLTPALLEQVVVDANTRAIMLGGYTHGSGQYVYLAFAKQVVELARTVSEDPAKRPTIILTAASQAIAASPEIQQAVLSASSNGPVLIFANAGEFRRLLKMDDDWRRPHEAKWWAKNGRTLKSLETPKGMDAFAEKVGKALGRGGASEVDPNTAGGVRWLKAHGWKHLEGKALEDAKQNDADYKAGKAEANERAFAKARETYCQQGPGLTTFVVTNGKHGLYVVTKDGREHYPTPPAPHGVVNTVGGGDGATGGYLVGYLNNLTQRECAALAHKCAGEIIGQDEARLRKKAVETELNGSRIFLEGLPGYLEPKNPEDNAILVALATAATPTGLEIERKFEVDRAAFERVGESICTSKTKIVQKYVPSVDDESLRLYINRETDGFRLIAFHPDEHEICSFLIDPETVARFGNENMKKLSQRGGVVPVGEGIEARVRQIDGASVMTLKAETGVAGERYELEFPISAENAGKILRYCAEGVEKTRYTTTIKGQKVEVDLYHNIDLAVAEMEIANRYMPIPKPSWLKNERTRDPKFSNREISRMGVSCPVAPGNGQG